jgi:hypothetical protein
MGVLQKNRTNADTVVPFSFIVLHMPTVRMHTDTHGVEWVVTKCPVCSDVHKYRLSDALAGPIACKTCKQAIDLQHAILEAQDASRLKDGGVRLERFY